MTDPTPGSPAWWLARAARPRRASALTAERIVDAAIELLDRDGLAAFSMRRLATALGTAAGSLYRHFESRDAVLVAVHDELIGRELLAELPPPAAGTSADEPILRLARAQWAMLTRRPYLATIWTATEQLGPNALRAREEALRIARASGVPEHLVPRAYLLVLHFTIAFAALHQGLGQRDAAARTDTEGFFASLPGEAFPEIRRARRELARTTVEEEFALGLQALTTGLRDLP